jgi:hypothetical protein
MVCRLSILRLMDISFFTNSITLDRWIRVSLLFFQGRPYAADFRTFFPVFPEIMYDWLKMVGVSRYTGRFENGFITVLVKGKFIFKNDAYIRFHVPDLIQAQLSSFNGPWDLNTNEPAQEPNTVTDGGMNWGK